MKSMLLELVCSSKLKGCLKRPVRICAFFVEAVVDKRSVNPVSGTANAVTHDFICDVFVDFAGNANAGTANFKGVAKGSAVAVSNGIERGVNVAGIKVHTTSDFGFNLSK